MACHSISQTGGDRALMHAEATARITQPNPPILYFEKALSTISAHGLFEPAQRELRLYET